MGFLKKLSLAMGLSKKECKIVIIGLDNSGKSTMINFMKPKKSAAVEVVPTVGMSYETIEKGKLRFQVFDMSGQDTYRTLWETYYKDVDAIIFVVDSSDKIRMCIAKDELATVLSSASMRDRPTAPLLVFANKCDIPGACEPLEVVGMLGLEALLGSVSASKATASSSTSAAGVATTGAAAKGGSGAAAAGGAASTPSRPWHVQASDATTGQGISDGFAWLVAQLQSAGSSSSGGSK